MDWAAFESAIRQRSLPLCQTYHFALTFGPRTVPAQSRAGLVEINVAQAFLTSQTVQIHLYWGPPEFNVDVTITRLGSPDDWDLATALSAIDYEAPVILRPPAVDESEQLERLIDLRFQQLELLGPLLHGDEVQFRKLAAARERKSSESNAMRKYLP